MTARETYVKTWRSNNKVFTLTYITPLESIITRNHIAMPLLLVSDKNLYTDRRPYKDVIMRLCAVKVKGYACDTDSDRSGV